MSATELMIVFFFANIRKGQKRTRTNDIGGSAAFTLGSLRIMYGDAKQDTISPKNKQQFLEDIISVYPGLVNGVLYFITR